MIETKNYSTGYDKNILFDLNFTACDGEITIIMGANGAGKTTLLKSLAGIIQHEGKISADGEISYLNQEITTENSFTVFETILLGKVKKLNFFVKDSDIHEVEKIIKMFNLEEIADKKINELSGGQRQKVFIAQALIKNPKILLLDEPTSSLDIKNQYEIMNVISKLTKDNKLTTVISLHQMDLIERFADNIIVLKDGKIFSEGKKEKIFCKNMFKEVYGLDSKIKVDDGDIMFRFYLTEK